MIVPVVQWGSTKLNENEWIFQLERRSIFDNYKLTVRFSDAFQGSIP